MKYPSRRTFSALCVLSFLFFAMALGAVRCAAQHADFSADVTSGCVPLTVNFTNQSTGGNIWSWSFGNGNSSSLQHPSAVFSLPGTYTVQLTVSNGSTSDVEIKTGYIEVYAYPSVDFTFDESSGCAPLTVQFDDQSTAGDGSITDWFWVFGDGGSSTERNPAHTFEVTGKKTVLLRVRNQYGCESSAAQSSAIDVLGPYVDFAASSTTFCQVPAAVQFTDNTTGDKPFTYAWDFGDGHTSTAQNPSYTFTSAGVYDVVLHVEDKQGCTSHHTTPIYAGSEGGLDFQPSALRACTDQAVTFSAQATSAIVWASWDFGDGTSSGVVNPAPVAYAGPGTYQVTLTAQLQDKSCQSVVTKTIEVLPDPVPTFSYSTDCNNRVTFTSTSSHAARVYWQLSNGYTSTANSFSYPYSSPGSYSVTLIAYNELNCSQTIQRTIQVVGKPVAAFQPNKAQDCVLPSLSGCAPFTIDFENTSSATGGFTSHWVFGDGGTSNSKDPSHTYSAGTYTVSLEVTNTNGCSNTTSAQVVVSDVTPQADFSISKKTVCTRETVSFTNKSVNSDYWCWDFGDGATRTANSTTHSYAKPGVYTVRLTAKNAGCTDTHEIVNAIEVKGPYVEFEIDKTCSDPYTVYLTNLSSSYHTLLWDFGDGQTATTNVGSHRFDATGRYTVQLTATNTTDHCTASASHAIPVYDVQADFVVDNPTPCREAPVTFTDQSQSAVRWEWSFDNGQRATVQEPTTAYSSSGQYTVTLRAFDPDGCASVKQLPIDVLNIYGDFSFTASGTCNTLEVTFNDNSSASPAILDYQWDFGDGHTATAINPVHTYQNLGEYPVTLTLTSAAGTCTFLKKDAVIFTNPNPDFLVNKTGNCIDESIQFQNRTIDAATYAWDFGNGETATELSPYTSYNATGSYNVTLTATDQYGCTKTVTKPKFISITQPEALFDASDRAAECPPLTTLFQDQSSGNIKSWWWDCGNGEHSSFASPAYTYLRPGEYDVTLEVTDQNNCSDVLTAEKFIYVGGPDGTFSAVGATEGCLYDTVAFTASTTNAVIHRWDYGDGNVEDFAIMDTEHWYGSVGAFNVALIVIDANGCEVVAQGQEKIHIRDSTLVDFTYTDCVFMEEAFMLQAQADETGMAYEWHIDGDSIGTGEQLQATIATFGAHRVLLKATNQYGCRSRVFQDIPVQGDVILVPNVFTPNNDAYNTVFEIEGLDRSQWDLHIYNRWGNRVYRKKPYANNWNGDDLASGVYFYQLINAFCPARKYKGTISIIR